MPSSKTLIVFVHGWSVTNTNTYGGLPVRLRNEARAAGIDVQIEEIFLGKYISFHDEVRVPDISAAFRAAVADQLAGSLKDGKRFACITHSTGGPVIRDWWNRYYLSKERSGVCPMSHLIMLAPANYGSALAQLGKGRISRMKSWFGGVEPGQGVLDWLELGSAEAWDLNEAWIRSSGNQISKRGVFPFVLTGQSIDRAFYDHLNSYTGESGSDGAVRVAAANVMGRYINLVQEKPQPKPGKKGEFIADTLKRAEFEESPPCPLRVVGGKSHSGKDMGIMRSVKVKQGGKKSAETLKAILACLEVKSRAQYMDLCDRFENETAAVQTDETLEVDDRRLRPDKRFFHDPHSQVIFRVRDTEGHPIADFDLVLTAGPDGDPNHLPSGFLADRQRNKVNPETITYFFNHSVMKGAPEVKDKKGNVVREKLKSSGMLGIRIIPRPSSGFVHYLPCEIKATRDLLEKVLKPNSTTLIDIRLRRIVRKNVFRVEKLTRATKPTKFSKTKPGNEIVDKEKRVLPR